LAFDVVRRAINNWDPYALIAGGAPVDEWESEVASIVAQIPRMASSTDAAHAISRTFASALEPGLFSPEDCEGVGIKLYRDLVDAKIL
jgi:hypothetical protein